MGGSVVKGKVEGAPAKQGRLVIFELSGYISAEIVIVNGF
jgi:hypothetical protein